MNVTFSTRQRHVLAQGLVIFGTAIVFVTLAVATGTMPSGFTVQSESLMAIAQGVLGA